MKQFCIDDLYLYRHLESLNGAASLDRCVFLKSRPSRKRDSYDYSAWSLKPGSGQRPARLTTAWSDIRSPYQDPTGKTLAFISKRDGANHAQVQLLPIDGGKPHELTRAKDSLTAIQMWSHDGVRLLLIARAAWAEDDFDDVSASESKRPVVARALPYKRDGAGAIAGYRTYVMVVDAKHGDTNVLVKGDFDVTEARWSPDGEKLAWVRNREGTQRHRRDLWLSDADGSNPTQMSRDIQSPAGIRWSADGSMIAFGGSLEEGDSLSQLWLCTVANREVRRAISDDIQLEGDKFVWHPDGMRIATIAARQGLHEVVVIDINSGAVKSLQTGLRHASDLTACGDRLVFAASSVRQATELFSTDWDSSAQLRHTRFNSKWFQARSRPIVRKTRFEVPSGADGGTETIEAWVLLPTSAGEPSPLLVDLHGGPQSIALLDFPSHVYRYALCAAGWAVLMPNPVGSGSYGTEFAKRLRGHWGELDLPQVLAVVDHLQADRVVDARVACAGKSYGGYLSAWAIGQTSRFCAAVVSAPVANVESHAGTSDSGYYVSPYAMDGELPAVRERIQSHSPTQHCHTSNIPTLLLQGDADERCPLGQSEEIFASLVRSAGTESMMVVYPGGSHATATTGKPSHRSDYHGRLAAWVKNHTRMPEATV